MQFANIYSIICKHSFNPKINPMNIVLSSPFLQMQKWSQNEQIYCQTSIALHLLETNEKITKTEKFSRDMNIHFMAEQT